jgi:hypothetical protein
VRAGIGFDLDEESAQFKYANMHMVTACIAFWVFGILEFLIIFRGTTLFSNKINLLQIFFHTLGIFYLLYFKG